MSEIDVQNAKQIRDPMTVLITMEVPDDEVTLTYSGYSSAKVADGSLGNAWPMRLLADLKGDGFPLNGNHVVYNPSTSASETNGKIGVRSNIGQAVSVTVTGNRSIASLSIFVTGAASVTYNGTTTAIVGGQAVIPVGVRSITLTFNPSSATDRIEVSEIVAGTTLRITNDTLIKATVSLRSDLSLFDQTLPESELNIEVYNDADISEIVASLPEDTPITYQAGYEGDMSPIRKFYVSGQVTWADNVLNIHAVDAVHFLAEKETQAPILVDDSDYFERMGRYMLEVAGVQFTSSGLAPYKSCYGIIPKGTNYRDFIASLNKFFNITDKNGVLLDGSATLSGPAQYRYVDAGIPTIRWTAKETGITIAEEDCADVNKNIEIVSSSVAAEWTAITDDDFYDHWDDYYGQVVGSATLVNGVGATLNFDKIAFVWTIGLPMTLGNKDSYDQKMIDAGYSGWSYMYDNVAIVPAKSDGWPITNEENDGLYSPWRYLPDIKGWGSLLMDADVPQEVFKSYPPRDEVKLFSSFIPWDQPIADWGYISGITDPRTIAQVWQIMKNANVFNADAEKVDLTISGCAVDTEQKALMYQKNGDNINTYNYGELPWYGQLLFAKSGSSPIEGYPEKSMTAPMYRSPITYSFTWKGDPRMQPRDVTEWERLDGTTETITLENITLTHEKGGTVAEITARKGIV